MKFVLAFYGLVAMSSPASLSAVSCYAEGTTCTWPSRPTWLASPSRLGLRRSATGRIRRRGWKRPQLLGALLPQLLEDPGAEKLLRESREPGTQSWGEMSTTLASLADGADLLLTGMGYQELAANVAEYHAFRWRRCSVTDPGQQPASFRSCRRR